MTPFKNFKEEFIFNLWKWKKVIHKNFIISATFTEASYIVIEYLAELTHKKINVVEFPRVRDREVQSKLFLHYSSTHKFTSQTPEIVKVVDQLLRREKNIDILCYSKTLAKSIISDKDIGKNLQIRFGKINDCTSENINNERPENEPAQNRFDNDKCNVGTNFKSGVSIRKDNHAYVIIFPSRHTQGKFKNNYGIFSSGITSVIQAIARQRTKGEIHLILPRPDDFNYSSLTKYFSSKQVTVFKKFYLKVKNFSILDDSEKVEYLPLAIQGILLKKFYEEELKENVQKGIDFLKNQNRDNLARLEYPPYKNFQLNESENYLASSNKFFGGDLSAYVTYCAFTNQFINCYLTGMEYKSVITFEENSIQKTLSTVLDFYFGEDYFHSFLKFGNFKMAYEQFRNKLFNEFIVRLKGSKESAEEKSKIQNILPYKNSFFEQQILRFVAFIYYGKSYYHEKDLKDFKKDVEYSRSNYLLDAIKSSKDLAISHEDNIYARRIRAFKYLDYFREKLVDAIRIHQWGNTSYKYLPVKPFQNFIEPSDLSKFQELVTYFSTIDPFTSSEVYSLIKRLTGNFEKQKNSLYSLLIEDFFRYIPRNTIPRITIDGVKSSVYPDISPIELPDSNNIINLIEKEDYNFPKNFLESLPLISPKPNTLEE